MTFDPTKLSPAPWESEGLRVWSHTAEDDALVATLKFGAMTGREPADCDFIALARNAFDIQMRRGWYAIPVGDGYWEAVMGAKEGRWLWIGGAGARPRATDPYSALVDAERWYNEQARTGAVNT